MNDQKENKVKCDSDCVHARAGVCEHIDNKCPRFSRFLKIGEQDLKWDDIDDDATFDWPEGVEVYFSQTGETMSKYGTRDSIGVSTEYNPDGIGSVGSPAWRAIRKAGLL